MSTSPQTSKPALNDVAMAPYWDAAAQGRLLFRHCHGCGENHYYPRPLCPFCLSSEGEWREACGRGTVYAWSVERRASPPYAIAFVTLEEGPTLMTNLVACDFDTIAVGQAVILRFEVREGQPVPVFAPA
jgi:uncharacterized OB-fold protein